MMLGHVRDRFPHLSLSLPGRDGPVRVEFLVDTGFDGDLALPMSVISRLEVSASDAHDVRLADGSQQIRAYYETVLDFQPLLGVGLLEGNLLQAEMETGGEVSVEPL